MRTTRKRPFGIYLRRLRPFPFNFRDYAGEIPGIMKAFIVFSVLLIAAYASAEDEFCQDRVIDGCHAISKSSNSAKEITCDLKYGGIDHVVSSLQKYANTHITRSYQYLLLSTHYGDFKMNRAGFEKLFRELSDTKWKNSIELIKHITKRGGTMDFNNRASLGENKKYNLYELESLAKAFDIEKDLAETANNIHKEATDRSSGFHDAEVAHFIEEKFVEKQADTVRTLAGYTTDLASFLKDQDRSLCYYLFDEYLQKQSFSF